MHQVVYRLFNVVLASLPLLLTGCGSDEPQEQVGEPVSAVEQVPGESVDALNSQNQFVPADTFIYVANVQPFSVVEWKEKFPQLEGEQARQAILSSVEQGESDVDVNDPALQYVAAKVAEIVDNPVEAMRSYGLDASGINWAFYMSGVLPVLRFELDDREQFLQQIPEFERETGLTATTQYVDDVEVRLYTDESDKEAPTIALAVVENSAIVTLTDRDRPVLRTTLGLDAVEDNIASTTIVSDLKNKYDYTADLVGFLDFTHLSKMLTDADSDAGKRLAEVMDGENADDNFAQLSSPQCSVEMTQIASHWPRLVMGYRSFDVIDDRFELKAHMAAELKHPKLLQALASLRGHIPHTSHRSESPFFIGLGVDAGQISSFINTLTSLMEGMDYQCPALAQLNSLQADSMPMMGGLAMFTFSTMVDGIRGIGVNLFDKDERGFDGAISVATENPEKLISLAQTIPQIRNVDLPEDGSAVKLGEVLSPEMLSSFVSGVDLSNGQVAKRGKQLVLFGGENGTALAQQPLESVAQDNGFLSVQINLDKARQMEVNVDSDMLDGRGSDLSEVFQDSNVGYLLDFTEHGIEIETLFDFDTRR